MSKKFYFIPAFAVFLMVAGTAYANHSWGKYHWDLSTETTLVSPLELGDNLTGPWGLHLTTASEDWNDDRSPLKNEVVSGTSNANCDPTNGQVEVCNADYTDTGWLGIASIWAKRGRSAHITQGVVKLNDYYFNQARYNTSPWRNLVMCQEVGHTFGLGHQDEDFSNLNRGTCMDYTADPEGITQGPNNEHPNQHDYDMLTEMYAHLNSTDGGDGGSGKPDKGNNGKKPSIAGAHIDHNDPSTWGKAIKKDAQGHNSLFERTFENGEIILTHVTWVPGTEGDHHTE